MPHSLPAARSKRPPLVLWLFVSVLGATIAAVLTCTLVIDRFVRDEASRAASQYLQAHADALRDALDRGMAQNYEQVRVLGQLDQVARSTDPAVTRRALEQMHASFPQYAWLGFAGRDGKVVAAIDGLLQGASVSARPWFSAAQHGMFVGDVHRALLLEKLLPAQEEPWRFVDIATPVYADDGSLRGVLGAHLSWTWAAGIKHDLVDATLAQHQAEAVVVGTDGTVLLGPAALQGRKLPPLQAGELSVASRTRGAGRFPGLGWNVVLRQPERVAMADFRALRERIRVAAALLCLVAAPLLWLLARRLAMPLRELDARLRATGDAPPPPRRHPLYREADLLGQALDLYARRHREDADHLRDLNASLEARVIERTAAQERTNEELAWAMRERLRGEEHLRAILEHAPDAYIALDERGAVSEWNRQAEQTFGWSRDEARGQALDKLLVPASARDARRAGVDVFTRGAAGAGRRVQLMVLHKSGAEIPVELSAAALRTEGGEVAYAFLHDVSARLRAELERTRSEQRLRTITDNLPVLISYIDKEQRYQFCNRTYGTWMGIDPAEMTGRSMREVLGPEEYAKRAAPMARSLAGERSDFDIESTWLGVRRHLHGTYVPDLVDGRVEGLYVLMSDVSAERAAEASLARQARTDSLTGLANRHAFNEKLAEALARSRHTRMPIALFFLDVDRFKRINDTLGHGAGDEVLKIFARRLEASVRETDTVARLAGDEFVVILECLHTPAEPQFIARKILATMGRPFDVAGMPVDVSTSIGIAWQADGSAQPSDLLAMADKALYEAKDGGRNTYRLASA